MLALIDKFEGLVLNNSRRIISFAIFILLLGALWNLFGGIFSKPLVIGNLAHFLISTIALIKIVRSYSEKKFVIMLSLTTLYAMFTVGFGYIFNKNPNKSFDRN